jgi:hypothetical protein
MHRYQDFSASGNCPITTLWQCHWLEGFDNLEPRLYAYLFSEILTKRYTVRVAELFSKISR